MSNIYNDMKNLEEKKVYEDPKDLNKKIKGIEEKLEIAKKQNTQRLCIPFTAEEMKKLEIAFNYRYTFNKRTQIASFIKKGVMQEVEEILKAMKERFFEE